MLEGVELGDRAVQFTEGFGTELAFHGLDARADLCDRASHPLKRCRRSLHTRVQLGQTTIQAHQFKPRLEASLHQLGHGCALLSAEFECLQGTGKVDLDLLKLAASLLELRLQRQDR